MPTLRTVSDTMCYIYIDGVKQGLLKPNTLYSFDVKPGSHFIKVISYYNNSLFTNQIADIIYDRALYFNFNELLKTNLDIIKDLEFFRYKQNGKFGFLEPITRTVIIEPQYDYCGQFSNEGLAVVKKGNYKGVINKKGEVVLPIIYDDVNSTSLELFHVKKDNVSGYIDYSGNLYLEMHSYDIHFLTRTIYYYHENGTAFLVKYNRSVIAQGDYDSFRIICNGYYCASKGNTQCVFNDEGKVIIPPDDYNYITFESGVFVVHKHSNNATKIGVIGLNGQIIIPFEFSEINVKRQYFVVKKEVDENWKWGILAKDGTILFPIEYFDIYTFNNDYVQLKRNDGSYEILKYDGLSFKRLYLIYKDDFKYGGRLSRRYLKVRSNHGVKLIDVDRKREYYVECDDIYFCDDDFSYDTSYLKIERDGKYGLIDISERLCYLTDCEYEEINLYRNGYACVKQWGRYGAIDVNGKCVIPCEYAQEFNFNNEGFAQVYKKTHFWLGGYLYLGYGIIDTSNNAIVGFDYYDSIYWDCFKPNYKDCYPLIRVEKKGVSHLIDYSNNIVATYDSGYCFLGGSCDCVIRYKVGPKENYKYLHGFVDKHGELVIPCKYDDIKGIGNKLLACKSFDKYALFNTEGDQLTDFVFNEVDDFYGAFAVVKKNTGYGVIDMNCREVIDFIYSGFDDYYVGEPFDVDIFPLLDWDTDEEGNAYCSGGPDIEGQFRYGMISARKAGINDSHIFLDDQGQTVVLRRLGDALCDIKCNDIKNSPSPQYKCRKHIAESIHNDFKDASFRLYTKVAGVTYNNRQDYCSKIRTNDKLFLKREQDNEYDYNAVAVYDNYNHQLGYIPKEVAPIVAQKLDDGESLKSYVISIIESNGGNCGVNLLIIA